jgi:hypothetical protein
MRNLKQESVPTFDQFGRLRSVQTCGNALWQAS